MIALNLVVENCRAALIALSVNDRTDAATYPRTDFATLRTDFLSILSLLYAASTKVALSLKPGAPAHHGASLVPLQELSKYVAALLHSVRLMRQTQGITLLTEYENVAKNVFSSVEYFADGLSSSLSQPESSRDHFVAVGKVHELIDNAKKHGALSSDNRAAVRKKWLRDYDSLKDGAHEIEEIGNPAELDDEDFVDDGWEELGLAPNQILSLIESERLKMVCIVGISYFQLTGWFRYKPWLSWLIFCINEWLRIYYLKMALKSRMLSWIVYQAILPNY